MPKMPRSKVATGLVAGLAIAIAVAGCGSSSNSTTGSTSAGTQQTTTPGGSKPTTTPQSGSQGANAEKQGSSSGGTGEEFGKGDPYSAPKGGDNSIQTYGDEASGGEKAAVTSAMFAFFRALAAKDYAKVCAGVSEKTREGVEQFMKLQHKEGSCPSILESIIGASPGGAQEAKKAANGSVGHVRVGEGNAFILFTPAGGKPSYFVMKQEGGQWKATGFNAGAPLNP